MDEKKPAGPGEGSGGLSPGVAPEDRAGESRGVLYVYVPGKKYPVPAGTWVRPSE